MERIPASQIHSRGSADLRLAEERGSHTWVALAGPEGNEFCVSRSASSRE